MTDGPAHAGSRDAGVKLQGQSEVAFRIMVDDAVEDAEKPNKCTEMTGEGGGLNAFHGEAVKH